MLNAQEDVITDVRMSIEIMTYVLQMSKLQSHAFSVRSSTPSGSRNNLSCRFPRTRVPDY